MNIGNLTILVGLPGAGKSTEAKKIRQSITGLCIEDFHACAINNSHAVKDSRHYIKLIETLQSGHDCVIADIAFCVPERRKALEDTIRNDIPKVLMKYIYFENDPAKCERNIRIRTQRKLEKTLEALKEFTPKYVIPDDVKPIPIWQP
jgi:adenylate kinase family enzyme